MCSSFSVCTYANACICNEIQNSHRNHKRRKIIIMIKLNNKQCHKLECCC